jgi:GTP-binding protein Era
LQLRQQSGRGRGFRFLFARAFRGRLAKPGHRDTDGELRRVMRAGSAYDLVRKPQLLALAADLTARLDPDRLFMISATQGDGVADLKQALSDAMPEGPWLYPEDEVSDATDRMIAAELTREQIVNRLHQELPYATAIETETWEDRPDGSTAIRQQILVERDSQKAIVIGKGGRRLKEIGASARAEIAQHLGRPVHLFLHVKVNPRWDEDRSLYREIGLDWAD